MESFIKLDINFFNDQKVKIIRKMPGGSDIIILWLGMLNLAMKSTNLGLIEIAEGLPHDADTLSIEMDMNKPTVDAGLNIFKRLKMIEPFRANDIEFIYIKNFEKWQQTDKIRIGREKVKLRVKKHRENKKIALLIQNMNQDVTVTGENCNTLRNHIEEEEEIEIEKEENKKKSIDFLKTLTQSLKTKNTINENEPR